MGRLTDALKTKLKEKLQLADSDEETEPQQPPSAPTKYGASWKENHLPGCPKCELCDDYQCFIHCSKHVTLYFSRVAALVVDNPVRKEFDPIMEPGTNDPAMDFLLNKIDIMVHTFDKAVNRIPVITKEIKGRYPIEVSYINAAGLANHGVRGIAMGPAFAQQMYEDAKKCVKVPGTTFRYNHTLLYEHTRNYIFPDQFTKVFEYSLDETDSNYGWTNQGFVDILGTLLLDQMATPDSPVELEYAGNNREMFMKMCEVELNKYLEGEYTYEQVFHHNLVPWNKYKSLDNVFAGILAHYYRAHGYGFVMKWFRVIPLLQDRLPPRTLGPKDRQSGIDNFYLAASFGAGSDQYEYLGEKLSWPISDSGRKFYDDHKDTVKSLFGDV
eukprot:CFRG7459T1